VEFTGLQLPNRVVRQGGEGPQNPDFIVGVDRHHEIDVSSNSGQAGRHDRKSADYNVTRAALIEFAAELDKVSLQRGAWL
jgi:hypothetical protein